MLQKVEGIVIRTGNYGETHKIVTLFTRERGKIAVMAKGAKKPKSKMSAITQPFVHASFLIQIGSNMGTLYQGEVLQSLRSIREDIIKAAYAAYISELTDKLVEENQPDPFLYQQLLQTMVWMTEDKDLDILLYMYELKMYKKGGFAPELNQCVNCGRTEGPYTFSVMEGGLLCRFCNHIDNESFTLPDTIIKLLRMCLLVDVTRIGNISVKDENKQRIREILDLYYERYGGYFLKSKKFLNQLDWLKD
ncbi:DNA repair protein RecO [Pontibacillus yanchengensis]|uniref:DNA repair protein RecO n=1 Tax=Pontibacillus yanchengensis Y32 TaxID=1385514 RepID=A0A0A2TFF1_9BACI|nr:DNA repair protein RecO [Pontibacillus yanchengensis]KGP73163.1 DNA recombination protein RecO [Pontibacillus yanchengensis Y32]